jgi:hypothetical protein
MKQRESTREDCCSSESASSEESFETWCKSNVDLSAFPDPAEFLDLDALQIESECEFVKWWARQHQQTIMGFASFKGRPPKVNDQMFNSLFRLLRQRDFGLRNHQVIKNTKTVPKILMFTIVYIVMEATTSSTMLVWGR